MSDTTSTENSAKTGFWKFLGAVVMELKKGSDGKEHLAVGMTRIMILIMFVAMLVVWFMRPGEELPDGMIEVFWTLLGLKGVNKVTEVVGAKK